MVLWKNDGVSTLNTKNGMMNNLERFHIYNETKLDNQINDKCAIKSNVIMYTIIKRSTSRGHSPLWRPMPALTLYSHKLQHNTHTLTRQAFQYKTKSVSSLYVRAHRFAGRIFVTNWIKQLNCTKYLPFPNVYCLGT